MSKTEVIREKIDALLSGRKFIPAFEINEKNILNIKEILEQYNPSIIDGYAECLTLIARYQKDKIHIPNLKAIISSAQMLTEDTRKIIEDIFGVTVIDKYGAREFSGIAYENNDESGYFLSIDKFKILIS
jgi:phenylacetate-CoA ligase